MLRGELTNLRAVERTDSRTLYRWFNDPAVMEGWGLPDATVSHHEVQRRLEGWLADEERLQRPAAFVIEDLEGNEFGFVLLSGYEAPHAACEVSLLIGETAEWGKGYAADALATLIDACFEHWQVFRLWLRVEPANERAVRLYERAGFRREAVLRDASYHDGRFHDLVLCSLLATDRRSGEEDDQ